MGVAISTLAKWGFVLGVIALYYRYSTQRSRPNSRPTVQRQRIEERPQKKEVKEKPKRQRIETNKDAEAAATNTKTSQPKERAPKPSASTKQAKATVVDDSSDDGIDNREFARQLASLKQGTNLNTKKSDEKRQKSVKQSRAQIIDDAPETKAAKTPAPALISAPSSTAGVDADDDESSDASPDLKAVDAGDVSDMLEPKASGPSVLRLTDTDKVKPKKEKKANEPEKTETKKQRQNRKKREQEQEQRREDERQRKAAEEAQRRTARIAEGRAAKDGSAFMASQAQKPSVWTGNGANGSGNASTGTTNGSSAPVAPLDTFDNDDYIKVSHPKAKAGSNEKTADSNWITTIPSEEEQMEMLRDEEAWNTVKTKKSRKKGTTSAANESANESEPSAAATKSTPQPQPSNGPTASGKSGKLYGQQSSFAALTTADEPEVEENEWDV